VLEREVSVDADGYHLAGTLCLPGEGGRFPIVLMLPGSGPIDRDENMRGQKLDIFNTIAHRLAESGVASLRYDKRGCGRSAGDHYRAGFSGAVADAARWADWCLSAESCEGRVFLLGHSEGTAIAANLSLQRPVSGLVLLCPFIADMESISKPGWSNSATAYNRAVGKQRQISRREQRRDL
jgi:pimeloyl-ACP methyl ester carboxylesterase